MKKNFLYLFVALIVLAKPEISEADLNFGVVMQPTGLNGDFTIISGARMGLNLDSNYYVGLALYASTLFKNPINAIDPISSQKPIIELNYYGVEGEYFLLPENTFHFSVAAFVGLAETYLNTPPYDDEDGNRYLPEYGGGNSSYVFKPTVNLNINIKPFYRIVVGVSYRYFVSINYQTASLVNDSDNQPYKLNSELLNGLALNFAVRFGGFALYK